MPVERVEYWGIPPEWNPSLLAYSLMALGTLVLLLRLYRHASLWWRVGRPEMRWDRPLVRTGRLLKYVVAQFKVLRERYSGVMHVALAWSFFVFFLGGILAAADEYLAKFLQLLGIEQAITDPHAFKFLKGGPYLAFELFLDTFSVFFLVGVGLAAYRRFIRKPPRLTLRPGFTWSLTLITVIVAGGLVVESLRLAAQPTDWGWWAPAGWLIAQLWIATGASQTTLVDLHSLAWLVHLLTVVAALITLPASTLLHIPTSLFNVFFSKLDRPMGQLKPIPQTDDGERIYVSTLRDLTWKQLLDADACTECGRCQDACPAFLAGTPLSPKQLMLDLRDALRRDGRALVAGKSPSGNGHKKVPLLVGETIASPVLWSCTTCGACVQECPVLVEHVETIVDMRRHLAYEGQVDAKLQEALTSLGRYGNSFGQSDRMRARWTQSVQPKIKDARREPVDYLWFVGDYVSYSAGLTDLARKTAEVFQKVGLDFGIAYEGERNAGNDVRRVGEEGLFEMLVERNVATLSRCTFKSVVTTDPHSYNTLKNEYPHKGDGRPTVLHSAELLAQLVDSGKLRFSKKLGYRVTYHDPCYLGRYNDVYDAPRRVIAATGCQLVEMPRHGDRALCCGAGGGRIWMDEGAIKERPSEARVREAAGLDGVSVLVVACPKDVTMYRDAVKTTGYEGRLVVKELIELVHEAL